MWLPVTRPHWFVNVSVRNHEFFISDKPRQEFRTVSNVLALLLALVIPTVGIGHSTVQQNWRKFKGAYFEVRYPPGFSARRSLKSNSFEGQFDSAFFYGWRQKR